MRCLQLVRDVGDEVAADVLEAPSFGDVLDDGDDAERAPSVVDHRGADRQGPSRRAVDVDRALGDAVGPALGEDVGDGLGRDGVAVLYGRYALLYGREVVPVGRAGIGPRLRPPLLAVVLGATLTTEAGDAYASRRRREWDRYWERS